MEEDTGRPTPEDEAEFERELERARRAQHLPEPVVVDGRPIIWAPQPGSQDRFLSCPFLEVLFHGTRGNGKSLCLLMSYAQHVGRGHAEAWRGVIVRQTYPQLADIVAKSEQWFRQIFPAARFNRSRMQWEWPTGECLMFRHMARPGDYWSMHGHELPFIGFEELTNWSTDDCYRMMFSCCRTSKLGVPRMIRATTNPYGVGMGWIKDRFRLAGRWRETVVVDDARDTHGNLEPPRCAIHGHLDENRILLDADPSYKQTIIASASNDAMAEAWLEGSWDITVGGMFTDVWNADYNVVPDFEVPSSWRIDRAFDWGSSRPFAVQWWAASDGADLRRSDGRVVSTVRGDLFLIREWYGWTGRPNEGLRMLAVDVAKGIVEREILWGWRRGRSCRVKPGPADSAIFTVENGISIAMDMEKPVRFDGQSYPGVTWIPADKRPGSRKLGWEMMRKMMRNAHKIEGLPREDPGLFVVGDQCPQFLRTVLSLPRSDKDLDDVDTDAEDHGGDAARYRVRSAGTEVRGGRTVGMF